MECIRICCNTSLKLEPTEFPVNLHVLPFNGADIILGVKWLQQLKIVTFDYERRSLTFGNKENTQTLTGLPTPVSMSPINLRRRKTEEFNFFKINPILDVSTHQTKPRCTLHVQVILDLFADSFTLPKGASPMATQIIK